MKMIRFLFPAAVLLPAFAQAASHDLATFIGEYDLNKDGRISSAEFFYSGWRMYAEHDYTRDGAVSMADKTDDKQKEEAEKPDKA